MWRERFGGMRQASALSAAAPGSPLTGGPPDPLVVAGDGVGGQVYRPTYTLTEKQ